MKKLVLFTMGVLAGVVGLTVLMLTSRLIL